MSGIGHNGGPSLEAGKAWRTHCWTEARSRLLPTLPIEVVRLRIRRAAELGLDYKTYAGVRATTGHDLVAFLFSTNALQLLRKGDRLSRDHATKLRAISNACTLIAAQPPLVADAIAQVIAEDAAAPAAVAAAPTLHDSWTDARRILLALAKAANAPADRILVVGATMLEREWAATARMAGFLPAERYFGSAPA